MSRSIGKKRELSFTIECTVAYPYLFILSICKYTTATCDGYLRISFNIEKVFYLQFHLTVWLPFFFHCLSELFVNYRPEWIIALIWKIHIASFQFRHSSTSELLFEYWIKSVQSGTTRLVIHCIDLAQLTSVNFTYLSLFLCWKFWIVFKRISFWEENLKRWQSEWRQH